MRTGRERDGAKFVRAVGFVLVHAFASAGCMLVGYEESGADLPAQDGGGEGDAEVEYDAHRGEDDASADELDASDATRPDASFEDSALDASNDRQEAGSQRDAEVDDATSADAAVELDADMPNDAAADATLPSDAAEHDATVLDDAGTASDAAGVDSGATCTSTNACGGCAALANAPGATCGRCGLGRFVCSGVDAVVCSGGNASPASSGGAVLIDDFEDGDALVSSNAGMSGAWFTIQDGTNGVLASPARGDIVPAHVGARGSARSLYISAYGFSLWGAGAAVPLNASGCSYDAAAQYGLTFYAKGNGTVWVSVATLRTTPASAGGTCVGNGCNDHFQLGFVLSPAWTLRTLPWTSLRQAGWGTWTTFQPSEILYIQFTVGSNSALDLYLDELSFY